MNIAICTDDNYVMPCMATIVTVLESNKDSNVNVFVLTEGLTKQNTERFSALADHYKQNIEVCVINSLSVSHLIEVGRFPKSVYYRFLLPDILAKEKRVLYLDCDIMVRHSLADMYATDLAGYACGAIEDQRTDDITIHNRICMFSPYFNSGVLLMNLEYWRKHGVCKKLIDFLAQNPEKCWFPDQDALNVCLEGKVRFLDYRYNMQGEMLSYRYCLLMSAQKWNALDEAIKAPCIIHFTDTNKPWYNECRHPYRDEYRQLAFSNPVIGFKLRNRDTLSIKFWTILGKVCVKVLKKLGRDFPEKKLF